MSGIVLSSSVRQNLLSLQSTADLLATTQNRLATGKKVNTALDNPTNFFTASGLDNRASDINNLLDGIGNGVQVLQAANTGISSLQKLVDSAKSVANQALQASVGYSAKSSVSTSAISGATSSDLRGTVAAYTDSTAVGSALNNNHLGAYQAVTVAGTALNNNHLGAYQSVNVVGSNVQNDDTGGSSNITTATLLSGTPGAGSDNLASAFTTSDTIVVNGTTISFVASGATGNQLNVTDDVGTLLAKINSISGGTSSITAGVVTLGTGTTSDLTISGSGLAKIGLTAGTTARTNAATTPAAITGATKLSGTASPSSNALSTAFTTSDTIVVNGTTISFVASGATGNQINITDDVTALLTKIDSISGGTSSVVSGQVTLGTGTTSDLTISGSGLAKLGLTAGTTARTNAATTPAAITGATKLSGTASPSSDALSTAFTTSDTIVVNGTTISFVASGATGNQINITDDVTTLLAKIDSISGGTGSSVSGGAVTLHSGTTSDLVVSGSGLAKLGLTAGTTARGGGTSALDGLTLTIGATGNGTATNITFGNGTGGTVKSLNDLNEKLAANNLLASISSTGAITISTTNDAASATIGAIGGTAAGVGKAFNGLTASAPTQDTNALNIRANLVAQYNNILDQITSTAQDASYNGVNLLNGDQLKLTFNETGTSALKIQGVTYNAVGLGLAKLTAGTDFLDNASAAKAIQTLDKSSTQLRTQASALGSNLSVVQIRQDFSKNLINVLQTGSSNLTLADTNEEAANSQALSTRQSIAVSALALANQSQQSILQLLR